MSRFRDRPSRRRLSSLRLDIEPSTEPCTAQEQARADWWADRDMDPPRTTRTKHRRVSAETQEIVDNVFAIARVHALTERDELARRRAAKQERAAADSLYPRGERVENVVPLKPHNATKPGGTGSAA